MEYSPKKDDFWKILYPIVHTPTFRYLAPFTRPDYIKFKHISMFGPPETGKTTYGYSIAARVEKLCEKVGYPYRCYRALDLETILNYIEEKRDLMKEMYLFFFIDDAEVRSPSVRTRATITNIGLHDAIRHKLNSLGMKAGYVTLLYATQRFKNLTPTLRNADIIIFKGLNLIVPDEYEFAYKIVGYRGIRHLKEWMTKMRIYGDDSVKGLGLCKLMSGFLYIHDLNPPQKPRNLIDLWHMPISDKARFKDRVKAELLKFYLNLNKVPFNPLGRPPYHYVTRRWLKSIGCNLALTQLGRLLDLPQKILFMSGRPVRGIIIYNLTEIRNRLRAALGQ